MKRPTVKVVMSCGHETVVYVDRDRLPFCFICRSFQSVEHRDSDSEVSR